MRHLPSASNERVLVGFGTSDDAGIFLLRDDLALVQTVDFFTAIVDDPFDFGRISAANALSDIYAMGATPLTALNIACFPEDLDLAILERILQGGATIALAAGVAVLGGHTVKDPEPKYGMAVSGTIDPRSIVTNAGAKPGDIVVLTKPLGTGILATALKNDAISATEMQHAVDWMTKLNDSASKAMLAAKAHAATDVTGFGLLGHAGEIARASGVQIAIDSEAVPVMPFVRELVDEGIVPGGSRANAREHATFTTFDQRVDAVTRAVLSDAQTSGGLLVAVDPRHLDAFVAALRNGGALDAAIGEVRAGSGVLVA